MTTLQDTFDAAVALMPARDDGYDDRRQRFAYGLAGVLRAAGRAVEVADVFQRYATDINFGDGPLDVAEIRRRMEVLAESLHGHLCGEDQRWAMEPILAYCYGDAPGAIERARANAEPRFERNRRKAIELRERALDLEAIGGTPAVVQQILAKSENIAVILERKRQDLADASEVAAVASVHAEIRQRVADALNGNANDNWTEDLSRYPAKAPTVLQVIGLKESKGQRFLRTAHDGLLTNGRVLLVLSEKERAKLPAATGDVLSMAKMAREMLAVRPELEALRIAGAALINGKSLRLLQDSRGRQAVVDATYMELIRKHYKKATFHFESRHGIKANDHPVIACADGALIGLIMPMSMDKVGKICVRPADYVSAGERIFAALEPASAMEADIVIGKQRSERGKKVFTMRLPGVAVLEVREGRDGGLWTVCDIGRGGQVYGHGLDRKKATALAKRLLLHAHGQDVGGGLIFKLQEEGSACDSKMQSA